VTRVARSSILPSTSADRRAGVKVTLKNFGRDRRYPIVNRFPGPARRCRSLTARHQDGAAKSEACDY
jgi:hypothetical protein